MLPTVSSFLRVRVRLFEFELQLRPYEYECQFSPMFYSRSVNPANMAKNLESKRSVGIRKEKMSLFKAKA